MCQTLQALRKSWRKAVAASVPAASAPAHQDKLREWAPEPRHRTAGMTCKLLYTGVVRGNISAPIHHVSKLAEKSWAVFLQCMPCIDFCKCWFEQGQRCSTHWMLSSPTATGLPSLFRMVTCCSGGRPVSTCLAKKIAANQQTETSPHFDYSKTALTMRHSHLSSHELHTAGFYRSVSRATRCDQATESGGPPLGAGVHATAWATRRRRPQPQP